jgi:hypothetical protein
MGGESVAWEFAVFEQEVFRAGIVARDQQMSIVRMFFGPSRDRIEIPMST